MISKPIAIVIAFALVTGSICKGTGAQQASEEVKYQRIGSNEYKNFIVGWDGAIKPQRIAYIRNLRDYNWLFQPAATNGSRGPFGPSEDSFTKEHILVVARQMPAPLKPETVFNVSQLREVGETLILSYTYNPPAAASYDIRGVLALRVPAKAYKRVVFIENGKEIGDLLLEKGLWVFPQVAPESDR